MWCYNVKGALSRILLFWHQKHKYQEILCDISDTVPLIIFVKGRVRSTFCYNVKGTVC